MVCWTNQQVLASGYFHFDGHNSIIVPVLGRCHEPSKPPRLGQPLSTWQPWLAVLTCPVSPSPGMNQVPKDL